MYTKTIFAFMLLFEVFTKKIFFLKLHIRTGMWTLQLLKHSLHMYTRATFQRTSWLGVRHIDSYELDRVTPILALFILMKKNDSS